MLGGTAVARVTVDPNGQQPARTGRVNAEALTALGPISDLRLSRDGMRVVAVVDGGLYTGAVARSIDGEVAIRDVRRVRSSDITQAVAADWRSSETIVAITGGPDATVAQISVDGLTLAPVLGNNLTPAAHRRRRGPQPAAAGHRPGRGVELRGRRPGRVAAGARRRFERGPRLPRLTPSPTHRVGMPDSPCRYGRLTVSVCPTHRGRGTGRAQWRRGPQGAGRRARRSRPPRRVRRMRGAADRRGVVRAVCGTARRATLGRAAGRSGRAGRRALRGAAAHGAPAVQGARPPRSRRPAGPPSRARLGCPAGGRAHPRGRPRAAGAGAGERPERLRGGVGAARPPSAGTDRASLPRTPGSCPPRPARPPRGLVAATTSPAWPVRSPPSGPTSGWRRPSRSPAAPAIRSASTPRSAPPTSRAASASDTQCYRRRDLG